MEKFTVDFFLEKFSKIPDVEWITGTFGADKYGHCAMGHCGMTCNNYKSDGVVNSESAALAALIRKLPNNGDRHYRTDFETIYTLNDWGDCNGRYSVYQQNTPKQRILAALRDIKAMQSSEQEVQVSDTTKVEKSVEAGKQKEKIRYVKVEIEEMELVEN